MPRLQTIDLEVADGVAILTLNRPASANALSREMLAELAEVFGTIHHDGSVRAVVLTGAGDRHFCAGVDLRDHTAGDGESPIIPDPTLADLVERLPQPVVAAINGACRGGGLELALACDFRLTSPAATFGLPEIKFGGLPAYGGTQRLPRLIGIGPAKRLIYLGEPIDASEALQLGLVSAIAPRGMLADHALRLARQLASKPQFALTAAKLLFREGGQLPLDDALKLERRVISVMGTLSERREAVAQARTGDSTYAKLL